MHLDGLTRRIEPSARARGGWEVAGTGIDTWLAELGAPSLTDRVPVLAYGSNRCPSKITWLRRELGLAGPVVALRVVVSGVAAVWAAGRRARDGARPATLTPTPAGAAPTPAGRPGVPDRPGVESHHVWLATAEQVGVLDRGEGRGERYDLARVHEAEVTDERGTPLRPVLAYWPTAPLRAPLLVDGSPVRCRDVPQDGARALDGVPGDLGTGAVTVIANGVPDPRGWPPRVFVYGTLQPGASAWWRLAPSARATWPALAAGRVHDTGRGYPALLRDSTVLARGFVVELADPVAALPALDAYEGPGYRRERVAVYRAANAAERPEERVTTASEPAGLCWAWIWDGPAGEGWPHLSSWPD